jgi:hypothetical protein
MILEKYIMLLHYRKLRYSSSSPLRFAMFLKIIESKNKIIPIQRAMKRYLFKFSGEEICRKNSPIIHPNMIYGINPIIL